MACSRAHVSQGNLSWLRAYVLSAKNVDNDEYETLQAERSGTRLGGMPEPGGTRLDGGRISTGNAPDWDGRCTKLVPRTGTYVRNEPDQARPDYVRRLDDDDDDDADDADDDWLSASPSIIPI